MMHIAANLFVIEHPSSDGPAYWANSPEHGCGWVPHAPKQAWSKSELVRELALMIERGYFTDCTVRRLWLAPAQPARVSANGSEAGG